MLLTMNSFVGTPVVSIQTGKPMANIGEPVIDPNDLRLVAFYVHGPLLDFTPAVIYVSDIREVAAVGAIVDSADNIMSPSGLVRLEQVINYSFHLPGIKVVDDRGHKLGNVENFGFDPDTAMINQLYLKPTFGKRLLTASLIVNRNQIIEIDNQKIIVKSPDVPVVEKVKQVVSENAIPFENPFRGLTPAPESKTTQ